MKRIIDSRKKEKFMVDDAYLNGQAKLCGHQATIAYLSLCRHASKDQECFPSIKLMAEEHAVSTRTIIRGLQKLEERNVIKIGKSRTKGGKWLNNTYTLLDKSVWDYSQVPNSHMDNQVTNMNEPSDKYDANQVTNSHTKETHIRKHIKKETHPCETSSRDIVAVIKMFEIVNPTISQYYGNTTQRASAERLLKKWTLPQIKAVVNILPKMNADRYAKGKSITPNDLEKNMGHIKSWIKQQAEPSNKLKIATISEKDWNAL